MSQINKSTLKFLNDLKKNNNREWFNDNKPRYEEARTNFEEFIANLIMDIAKFDPPIGGLNPKKSIFRIYRDARFSKDKTPYKINLGAHLSPHAGQLHDRAGYYIHLEPNKSFLAGGAYLPPAPWLNAIRYEINRNSKELKKIINSKNFKNYFGELEGEKLKSAPRDYPKDHPEIELLKFKSYLAVHKVSNGEVLSDKFLQYSTKIFKLLHPFDNFLNTAIENHQYS